VAVHKKTIWFGVFMDEKDWREKLETLKKRLKIKFVEMAEPMKQVEYTRENYDKLFPDNKVITPLGEVQLRDDQFNKLNKRKREEFLGATHQIYADPIAIVKEERDGKIYQIFGKSFKELSQKKIIMSVIDDGYGVTAHRRPINNFLNKIKKPADLLYEKQINGAVGQAGDDTYARNLASKGNTQSINNIPQSPSNVKGKNKKNR